MLSSEGMLWVRTLLLYLWVVATGDGCESVVARILGRALALQEQTFAVDPMEGAGVMVVMGGDVRSVVAAETCMPAETRD